MKLSKLVLVSMLVFLPASAASACDGGNLAMAYLFGYNNFNQRAGVFNNYTPPYFSLHPPVYYGERFYRPYGASPFAAWPQLQPNPAYAPKLGMGISGAAIIENPHCHSTVPGSSVVPQSGPEAVPAGVPDVVKKSKGPLIIDNPFYVEDESQLASTEIY